MEQENKAPYIQVKIRGEAMAKLVQQAEASGKTITQYMIDLVNQQK